MKQWIVFLIVPVLMIFVFELISAFVLGGIFHVDHLSFWGIVSTFVVHFFGGVAMLHLAPNKKPALAYALGVLYACWGIYLGIDTHGNVIEVFGERVVQEFSIVQELAKVAGIFLGILGAVESEKEEAAASA